MIIDKLTTFCWETSLNTGGAGSYLIGDVIDTQNLRDQGQLGGPLFLDIVITTAVAGTSSTVAFKLCSDAQAAIAVDGSQTIHYATALIAEATLVAGYTVCRVAIPLELPLYERYLGIVQQTAVAALSAGKVSAFLTPVVAGFKAYPNAVQ